MELCYLSFPPPNTHKLKPLYRSIYATLKKFVSSASDTWLRSHTDKTYVPLTVNKFQPNAPTQRKINFGLLPLNIYMFTWEDFSSTAVTDFRIQNNKSQNFWLKNFHNSNSNLVVSSQPSTSGSNTSRTLSEELLLKSVKQGRLERLERVAGKK
jgi:hypothetical protein